MHTSMAQKIKPNVLVLATITALMIVGLMLATPSEMLQKPEVLALFAAVAGAFVGGAMSVMNKLVDPEPDPAVPASVVVAFMEALQHTPSDPQPKLPNV